MNPPWIHSTHLRPPLHHHHHHHLHGHHHHKLRSATPPAPKRGTYGISSASAAASPPPRSASVLNQVRGDAVDSGPEPGFIVDYKAIQKIADGVERMVLSWSSEKPERARVYANAYDSLHTAAAAAADRFSADSRDHENTDVGAATNQMQQVNEESCPSEGGEEENDNHHHLGADPSTASSNDFTSPYTNPNSPLPYPMNPNPPAAPSPSPYPNHPSSHPANPCNTNFPHSTRPPSTYPNPNLPPGSTHPNSTPSHNPRLSTPFHSNATPNITSSPYSIPHGMLVHYDPHHHSHHNNIQCNNGTTDEDCENERKGGDNALAMQNGQHHRGLHGVALRKLGTNDSNSFNHSRNEHGQSNSKGDSYNEAKVKELEISLLECATEYEVQIVEMKMKMLQMKSEFRQKEMEEKAPKPLSNITNVNGSTKNNSNKQPISKQEMLDKGLSLTKKLHNKNISNTNQRPRSQGVPPKKVSSKDQEKDVVCLQKLLNKKEQELTNSKNKEKELASQIQELQALVQKGRGTQIEPKKLLSLLLALNECLQSIKAGVGNGDPQVYYKAYQNVHALAHLRMNFAENTKSANANRSPQLENIASIVNKEIKTLQGIVGKLDTQKKKSEMKK